MHRSVCTCILARAVRACAGRGSRNRASCAQSTSGRRYAGVSTRDCTPRGALCLLACEDYSLGRVELTLASNSGALYGAAAATDCETQELLSAHGRAVVRDIGPEHLRLQFRARCRPSFTAFQHRSSQKPRSTAATRPAVVFLTARQSRLSIAAVPAACQDHCRSCSAHGSLCSNHSHNYFTHPPTCDGAAKRDRD